MSAELRSTVDGVRQHLVANPGDGEGDDVPVRVTRTGSLAFTATDANGRAVASDMVEGIGGTGAAMSPGGLFRAALGACDATTLAITAAGRGVELTRLEVAVASRSDDRGIFGLDDVQPEPLSVHVTYHLASDTASDAELRDLVAVAEARSPVRGTLAPSIAVTTEVVIG